VAVRRTIGFAMRSSEHRETGRTQHCVGFRWIVDTWFAAGISNQVQIGNRTFLSWPAASIRPTPASRRVSDGLGTTAESNTVVRPRPASCRRDGGLKTRVAKWSNLGFTGAMPTGAELRLAACGSLPNRGSGDAGTAGARSQWDPAATNDPRKLRFSSRTRLRLGGSAGLSANILWLYSSHLCVVPDISLA
jgi:hypothetical protein